MARGNPKPTEKTNWIPDDTTNIVPPSAGRKLVGWLFNIKPPAEIFNWAWNLKSRFEDYFGGQVEDWIVIDSDADEGDYATLATYLADAPAAGNRVLIKEDQTVTVQTVIPSDITLKFLDGSRLLCATNIATSVTQWGSDIIIEGVLNIVLSQTGVTAKAVELNGDNVTGKINIENSSTGTLTTGIHVNASKTGNNLTGFIDNTGGGILTNEVVDNSNEDSNSITFFDAVNNVVVRSRGARTFGEPLIADGGIQTDGVNTLKTKVIDIGDWDMAATTAVNINHGLTLANIRKVDVLIRNDADSFYFDLITAGSTGIVEGDISVISGSQLTLYRVPLGYFDDVDFDATSYNRGWAIITYIA